MEYADTYKYYLMRLDAPPCTLNKMETDKNSRQTFHHSARIIKGRYLDKVEDNEDGSSLFTLPPFREGMENITWQCSIIFINVHLEEKESGKYKLSKAVDQQILASLAGEIADDEEDAYGQY